MVFLFTLLARLLWMWNFQNFQFSVHVPTCRTFSTQLLSSNFNPLVKLRLCESDALNDDALYWINNYNWIIIMKIGVSRFKREFDDNFLFFFSISYYSFFFFEYLYFPVPSLCAIRALNSLFSFVHSFFSFRKFYGLEITVENLCVGVNFKSWHIGLKHL